MYKPSSKILAGVIAGAVLSGCAGQKASDVSNMGDFETQLRAKEQELDDLRSSMDAMKRDSARQAKEIREAQDRASAAEAAANSRQTTTTRSTDGGFINPELLPPNAKAGECYARVFIPPTYKTEDVRVLRKEAGENIEIIPAAYEWTTERVLVKEATERLEIVPATYKWTEERLLIKPASKRIVEVPEVWETVTEKILERPAHQIWKKGRGPVEKLDEGTGEIMCLIEVPAVYDTVTKRIRVTEGRMDWRPVLCETNMYGTHVTGIQRALLKAGFNPGRIDGVIGSQTSYAIRQFQKSKGLAKASPAPATVTGWVEQAKTMDPKITH